MWIMNALASAFFAGTVSILVKVGIKNVDSTLATALRTIVVAAFSWLMVFVVGSQGGIASISAKNLLFLILSGLATGGSWLCYFRALQTGDVNKVVPVDKSSTVLTMLLSFFLFRERFTWLEAAAIILIGAGTYLMIERRKGASAAANGYGWLPFAILSALLAALSTLLGKAGIEGVESNLGTAIRTVVVLVMAWFIVLLKGKQCEIKNIDPKSWVYIGLSGIATGMSWLCFYRALQEGPASVVVPIDKLSILFTVAFGYFILHEKLGKKPCAGLALIVTGTVSLLL